MIQALTGDCRTILPTLDSQSVQCVVTSPPYYGLRDYGVDGQIGLERTPDEYVAEMVAVFREVRRVLREDGTVWFNLGDSYAAGGNGVGNGKQLTNIGSHIPAKKAPFGFKPKDLLMMPARVALALQADGWYLRSEIVWAKPNPMPESVTDRPTSAHEKVFLLTKSARYFYDADAVREECESNRPDMKTKGVRTGLAYLQQGPIAHNSIKKVKVPGDWDRGEGAHGTIHRNGRTSAEYQEAALKPGRNLRNVWMIATAPFAEAHFATMPPALAERCIRAGTSEAGCCECCGAPFERMTETKYKRHEKWFGDKQGQRNSRGSAGTAYNEPIATITTGWRPTCDCAVSAPVPCTVLDPFGGAGTTALVADRLQRHAIHIDLSGEYMALAKERLTADSPLFAEISE